MKFIEKPNLFGGGFQKPNKIIIHSMGEYIDDNVNIYHATEWLEHLKLSAHFLITPGGVVIKTRDIDRIAYHAKGHNTNTIGIEFLVPGIHDYSTFLKAIKTDYVTDFAWKSGIELIRELGIKDIVRHSDIDPERKKDPGSGFEFDILKATI